MGWVPTNADPDAIHDNVSAEISAIAEKATPVDADLVIIEDSAASNAKKRVQVGNLPGAAGGGGKSYVTMPGLAPPGSGAPGDIEFLNHANGVDPTVGPAMSWGNQGSATGQVDQGRLVMDSTTVTSLRALLIATPGAGNFDIDTMVQALQFENTHAAGLVFLWGTPGTPTAIRFAGMYHNTGTAADTDHQFVWTTYNTSWAATADVASIPFNIALHPAFLRVEWDGTDLTYYVSPSAIAGTFEAVYVATLGLGRPDYVGVGVNNNGATNQSIAAFGFLRFDWAADWDPTTDD